MQKDMSDRIPELEAVKLLLNEEYFSVWEKLCDVIEAEYEMERLWNSGGKAWAYEYKYRRGGKTLCALYARENCMGFMVIMGKAEREKFERCRQEFSADVLKIYDEAETYLDGKWIMFYPKDRAMFEDFMKMLKIKRRPNRK